ncbi:hypothetical protein ETAA8_22250 [Anatilimnocola aggregata]|uniref:Uncharacterized protein n=1 Tax=Anatilimnocola aggregata TaxID=2528021 RepID=A0A517YA73_9BACT|nr:hypothetical protein [Anatilimnocola aggregata]QDU27140.1 hypothetical protein ETAA8_22250 [Anatilimnocola aggregata]
MWLNQWHEYAHEHASRDEIGTIEINTQYVTRRKPAWLVLLKLFGLAFMVAIAIGIAYPSLRQVLAPLQSMAVIAGVILIYSGLAFFFRPEPNTDNLGFCGGMRDDPFKYSDDINRGLMDLDFVLGPGRYVSETLLDACVLVGLAGGEEVIDDSAESAAVWNDAETPPKLETVTLRSDRFEA